MHNSYRDSIGAPKVPKVLWSDIGGLADLKEEIMKSIKNPTGGLDILNSGNSKRSGKIRKYYLLILMNNKILIIIIIIINNYYFI